MSPDYYFNFLDPAKTIYIFTMVFHFWFLKRISSQWNFLHEWFIIWGLFPKWCIKLTNIYSWEPSIDQVHSVIILIYTKTKRRLHNTTNQLFNDRSFLVFYFKLLLEDFSYFRKSCHIIGSIQNIISIYILQDRRQFHIKYLDILHERFRTATTESRSLFHWRPAGFLPRIPFIYWMQNGLPYQLRGTFR